MLAGKEKASFMQGVEEAKMTDRSVTASELEAALGEDDDDFNPY